MRRLNAILRKTRGFLLGGILLSAQSFGSVVAVGPDSFLPGSPVLTFDGFADGTEVNGLAYDGVRFSYEVGGVPINSGVLISGPSVNIAANHVTLPAVLSNPFTSVNKSGTLILDLPSSITLFGFGYVVNTIFPGSPTAIVSLLSGPTLIRTLVYTAVPDPGVPGGFAGIQSTTPFERVALTFGTTTPEFFGVDNTTFTTAAPVPEPSTILLGLAGLLLCGFKFKHAL